MLIDPKVPTVAVWQHRCSDRVGGCTAISEDFRSQLTRLLHLIDGQLGLAVYRNERDELWKKEASEYIIEIRKAIKRLNEDHDQESE